MTCFRPGQKSTPVKGNLLTGSVLISFDLARITFEDLYDALDRSAGKVLTGTLER